MFEVEFLTLSFLARAGIENEPGGNALEKEGVGGGHADTAAANNGDLKGFLFKHSFSIAENVYLVLCSKYHGMNNSKLKAQNSKP